MIAYVSLYAHSIYEIYSSYKRGIIIRYSYFRCMKIAVSIKVRNPEYYWSKEEIKKSHKEGEMSYEEWLMINGDKIQKHIPSVTFEYDYEVIEYNYPEGSEYELTVVTDDGTKEQKVKVSDVTVIEFIGKEDRSIVVVSNDILHQFLKAKKDKGRTYWYFYIKEDSDYIPFTPSVWLSKEIGEKIFKQIGDYGIINDAHIKSISKVNYLV